MDLQQLLSNDKKQIESLEKLAENVLSIDYTQLSDEELKNHTQLFKDRIQRGESLDDILPEAFATVCEAATRVTGLTPYKVQIMGAIALHQGHIAEMKTGEGKTLTSALPAYLNALEEEGVHIVTVNDYLAGRDAENMGAIHRFLGLTVGFSHQGLNGQDKKKAYQADITYVTNSELGFDYLRDNMIVYPEQRVLRGLHYAIIDEVDSILIDEARTPLIISGQPIESSKLYLQADHIVKQLVPGDFKIDEPTRTVALTASGIDKIEKLARLDNLYDAKNGQFVHHIQVALTANFIMHDNIDYVVQNDEVKIVDSFTGRIMEGRRYNDGLHQALEAKENVPIQEETKTVASITFQNFFRLYDKTAGMTGTAKTEEEEFKEIYDMDVIQIPTNRPVIRQDYDDQIYPNKEAKYDAILKRIQQLHNLGLPILIGTVSVETSELLSNKLDEAKLPHNVLNAKNHAREAEIIQQAGQHGAITIATNMAGRGTDIQLGHGVAELGGLVVIGTERHDARRIDDQLRGRSGRQGDPGMSQFYISLEDDLLRRFGSERIQKVWEKMSGDNEPLQSKFFNKQIGQAQTRVEGSNYDARKHVLEYDQVLSQQREIIYKQRNVIINSLSSLKPLAWTMVQRAINQSLKDQEFDPSASQDFAKMLNVPEGELENMPNLINFAKARFDEKFSNVPHEEQVNEFLKVIILYAIDQRWTDHIDDMENLKETVRLSGYAQNNPLMMYQEQAFLKYEVMLNAIDKDVTEGIFNSVIMQHQEREMVD